METKAKHSWTTEEVLAATCGRLLCGNSAGVVDEIVIDSRQVKKGDLFVAIRGERLDGHDFVPGAVAAGAAALIVDTAVQATLPLESWRQAGITCIAVADTTVALGHLAAFNRRRSELKVVAITGSNGKTTTRRLTSAVAARQFVTLSTLGNFNNEIGLPLSLLTLGPEHRLAVLELGMNHAGEISRLGEICSPDVGVITNVGPVHLEFLGSLNGVARAKGELLEKINPGGWAVLNADDPLVAKLAQQVKPACGTLFFGLDPAADIRANDLRLSHGLAAFELVLPAETIMVSLKVPGRVMVSNALAAAAVGHLLGMEAAEIKAGLESIQAAKGRMEIIRTAAGINIIDDTYNANPISMGAALGALGDLAREGRRFFACGDMLELGDDSDQLHHDIGAMAAAHGVERIFAFGPRAHQVAAGARSQGMAPEAVFTGEKPEIVASLKELLQPGDWLLVKGSRGMAMEEVVIPITKWAEEQ